MHSIKFYVFFHLLNLLQLRRGYYEEPVKEWDRFQHGKKILDNCLLQSTIIYRLYLYIDFQVQVLVPINVKYKLSTKYLMLLEIDLVMCYLYYFFQWFQHMCDRIFSFSFSQPLLPLPHCKQQENRMWSTWETELSHRISCSLNQLVTRSIRTRWLSG